MATVFMTQKRDQKKNAIANIMNIPQKTPRLKLRIVSGDNAVEFTAATPNEFEENYHKALELAESEFSISQRTLRNMFHDNLHIFSDERWFRLQTLPVSEQANRAQDGENVILQNIPDYDIHLAVLKAGSAKEWFTSNEGIWIICQYTWLWGRELSSFTDSVVDDFFDDISENMEKDTGEFEPRVIRNFQKN